MTGDSDDRKFGNSVYVAFTGETDLPYLRLFLKPGFRHCFVVLNDGQRWLSFDPLAHKTDIAVYHHIAPEFDLPGWLRARGLTVIEAPCRFQTNRPAPWMAFTCVEAVKRVIGLHARFVLTPWQLYRHLFTLHETQKKETSHGKHKLAPEGAQYPTASDCLRSRPPACGESGASQTLLPGAGPAGLFGRR